MMPLCTTAIVSRDTIGCAFFSDGAPCVAQRVWAMQVCASSPSVSTRSCKSATRRNVRSLRRRPSRSTAIPHES